MKNRFKRIVPIIIILTFLLSFTFYNLYNKAYGSTSGILKVTFNDCINMALSNNSSIPRMDITVKSLQRQYEALEQSKSIFLANLKRYKELYDMNLDSGETKGKFESGEITEEEYNTLIANINEFDKLKEYFTELGVSNPELMDEEDYLIVAKFDIPMKNIELQIKNTQNNKLSRSSSIIHDVRNLYDNILDMEDDIELKEQVYENSAKHYDNTLANLREGHISESDRYKAENALKSSGLELDILRRNLYSNKISLKASIGATLSRDIDLAAYSDEDALNHLLTLEEYTNNALSSRVEVLNAQNDMEEKQWEQNIIKQYVNDTDSLDYKSADNAAFEKSIAYMDAVDTVKRDIEARYNDVQMKQSSLESLRLKLDGANQNQVEVQKRYETGGMSSISLEDSSLSLVQAQSALKKAERDYYSAIFYLELASGLKLS